MNRIVNIIWLDKKYPLAKMITCDKICIESSSEFFFHEAGFCSSKIVTTHRILIIYMNMFSDLVAAWIKRIMLSWDDEIHACLEKKESKNNCTEKCLTWNVCDMHKRRENID